jgi:hypothetical protein
LWNVFYHSFLIVAFFSFILYTSTYKWTIAAGEYLVSEFERACTEAQIESLSGREIVDVVDGKQASPLDDPEEIRTFVVNKLLLEADAGDSKNRMRALELLGKVGEVGLFVEKKEVVHKNYKEEEVDRLLEQKIKELMHEKTVEAEVLTLENEANDVEDAQYVEE